MKPSSLFKVLSPLALLGATLLTLQPSQAYAQTACLQVPVGCRVTSAFGPRFNPITKNYSSEYHHGMDFGCPIGTSIVAADGGVVNVSGFSQSAGNWVVVRSPGNGPLFKYMHGERTVVSVGTMVNKGQQVLISGNTGRSTGPHLHFQMEVNGTAQDPMPKFCSRPPLKDGVLQGAESDVVDAGSQATPPSDNGGTPPAMGMDGSLHEVLGDAISARALNPDYMRQLSTLTEPRLYAELSYMKAIRLKVQSERAQHRERIEATQAMIQLLRTEGALRSQLDAQRIAATRAGAEKRR
jgi:murein DD-endopeptidase MepM/ murein hydrolase activator NlpD